MFNPTSTTDFSYKMLCIVFLGHPVQKPTSCSQKSLKIIILNLFYRDTSCRAGFGTGRPGQLGCEKSKSNFGFQRIGTCIENEKVVQFVRLQFAKLYLVLFSLLFQNLPFKAGGTLELKSLKNKAENCFLLEIFFNNFSFLAFFWKRKKKTWWTCQGLICQISFQVWLFCWIRFCHDWIGIRGST